MMTIQSLKLHLSMIGIGAVAAFASTSSAATVTEYSRGHADIGLAYDAATNELDLHYHFGGDAVLDPATTRDEFNPSEAYVRVADAASLTVSAAAAPFFTSTLGVGENGTVYILPQSVNASLPFLGFSTDELNGTPLTTAEYEMTRFSGPGEFVLYQAGLVGAAPNVFMQSNDGVDASDADDTVALGIGGHSHYNFGFSDPGVYEIDLTATATGGVPGGLISDTETFRFAVGSATAVPEPGSLLVLASAGVVGAYVRRRRAAESARASS